MNAFENCNFSELVDKLSTNSALKQLYHENIESLPLPSSKVLEQIIELTRSIIFPGYYGISNIPICSLDYFIGSNIMQLHELLSSQIVAGLCFDNSGDGLSFRKTQEKAEEISKNVIEKLPDIQATLATDVEAAFNGDPAADNIGEIISCYPVIRVLTNYRFAHELYLQNVPLIPRILTEMAHSETGIDIHPAAQIGKYFTIDHGTGVVIGSTCIIGDHVKLYQGVTLGAKSFPLDDEGNPIKGIPRHPILKDNVTVYSNATVLGRITIGKGTIIGGNIWVTESTKDGECIVQAKKSKSKSLIKDLTVYPNDYGLL